MDNLAAWRDGYAHVASRVPRRHAPPSLSRTCAQLGRFTLRDEGKTIGIGKVLDLSIGKDEAIDQILRRTRRFAVRQERWFRRDPRIRWVDVGSDLSPAVAAAVRALGSAS